VHLQQADVLAFETLPSSWTNNDLIVSASMLEYLPKRDFPRALAGLSARLAPDGHILVMITRKTPETKVLIDWWWPPNGIPRTNCCALCPKRGSETQYLSDFPGLTSG